MLKKKHGKRYDAEFKFKTILQLLSGEKTSVQIARSYGISDATIVRWKNEFLERGPEIFSEKRTVDKYEKKVKEMERIIGHKEVEIALLKNFFTEVSPGKKKSKS